MTTKHAVTPNEVRARMVLRGQTLSDWARDHGFPRDAVYRVLGGQYKGRFGQAHRIAVALGLKVVTEEPSTITKRGDTPAQRVA